MSHTAVNMSIDRSKAPGTEDLSRMANDGQTFGYDMLRPETLMLANGIPLYLLHSGEHELLRLEFIFDAGLLYQTKNLQAYMTNHMLREGSKTHTAYDISRKIEYFGASLSLNTDRDKAYVTLYLLEKHLEYLLPLISEIIFHPVFPEKELKLLAERQRREFLVNMEKVSYLATRHFTGMVFGKSHPYGTEVGEHDFSAITPADLLEFHRSYYHPATMTIIACGKRSEQLAGMLDKFIGQHPRGTDHFSPGVMPFFDPDPVMSQLLVKKGVFQSALRIGLRTISPGHADHSGLKVLNTLLGGFFGSRLMKNIREDKGYTYGIGSSIANYRQAGYWVISSEVAAEHSRQAVTEIRKEISRLRQEMVEEEELKLVRNYMLGAFLRSVDGPFELGEKIRERIFFNLSESHYRDYINTVQSITREELCRLAGEYLPEDGLFELIVGA